MNDSSITRFLRSLVAPRRLVKYSLLAGLLTLGLASAAADLSAEFVDGQLVGPQVFAGEGYRTVSLVNNGTEDMTFTIARLNNGFAVGDYIAANDALNAAIASGDQTAAVKTYLETAVALSGAVVKPHAEYDMVVDLEQGSYVIASHATSSESAASTYLPFEVTASGSPVAAPETSHTLQLADFSFDFPATMKAGNDLWKVTNVGDQPHIAAFFKLTDGKTQADLETFLKDTTHTMAPPFDTTTTVDIEALSPGQTVYMPLDLTAGNWVAVCFVQDLNNPAMAHYMEGMIEEFTVN
ncbi:MAG TPA: hypothetical protein VFN07_08185 [Trueperaceae bacterium]|nr:hypothetical protein [Trueperaceae bacterium]